MFEKLYQKIRLLRNKNKEPYSSLYKIIGFYPKDIQLYEQALLHKSSSVEIKGSRWQNNERLEFLGDAILDAIVADILYKRYPNKKEGFLTNTRSKIVSRDSLNRIALELGLDKKVIYSIKVNLHHNHILGNALEALIGAIYLDLGYDKCFSFIEKRLISQHIDMDKLAMKEVNFKSNLVEWSQRNKEEIEFRVLEAFCDEEKNPIFQTGVFLADKEIGIGTGYSKKESQQHAARMALRKLHTDKELKAFLAERKRQRIAEAISQISTEETTTLS